MADIYGVRKNNTNYDFIDKTKVPYDLLQDTVGFTSKNLVKNNNPQNPYTNYGITFTYNPDGTVTANGTNNSETNDSYYSVRDNYPVGNTCLTLPVGKYILSGISGGSSTTFKMRLQRVGDSSNSYDLYDGERTINITQEYNDWKLYCIVVKGNTVSDKVFYPMLRKADIMDSTYEPYHISGVVSQEAQNVLGAKNLLKYPYYETTKTSNGVTFTDNGDGTIGVNGTATADAYFTFHGKDQKDIFPEMGNYLFGAENGNNNCYMYIQLRNDDDTEWGSQVKNQTPDAVLFTRNSANKYVFSMVVKSGTTVNNIIFKPMVRLAEIKDDTYVPYAKTNRELTEDIIVKKISNVDLNNITTTGTYYMSGSITNSPNPNYGILEVINGNDYQNNFIRQIIYPQADANIFYTRIRNNSNVWGSWYKFEGTVIS